MDVATGLLLWIALLFGLGYAAKELGGGALARFFAEHTARTSEDPNKRMIGAVGEVVETSADGALRVRIGIERWNARLPSGTSVPPAGAEVRVTAVEGTLLHVEPYPPAS